MHVQIVDDQCTLQITPLLTACCVLHRPASRVVHRQKWSSLFFSVLPSFECLLFVFRPTACSPRASRSFPQRHGGRAQLFFDVKLVIPFSSGSTRRHRRRRAARCAGILFHHLSGVSSILSATRRHGRRATLASRWSRHLPPAASIESTASIACEQSILFSVSDVLFATCAASFELVDRREPSVNSPTSSVSYHLSGVSSILFDLDHLAVRRLLHRSNLRRASRVNNPTSRWTAFFLRLSPLFRARRPPRTVRQFADELLSFAVFLSIAAPRARPEPRALSIRLPSVRPLRHGGRAQPSLCAGTFFSSLVRSVLFDRRAACSPRAPPFACESRSFFLLARLERSTSVSR